jgi:hypothetical protein
MKVCRSLWIAVSLFGFVANAVAQSDPPPQQPNPPADQEKQASPCAQVQIQSQARAVRDGQPVSFTARITGGDRNVTPSLLWNVSAGSIRDGQGTARIDVDSTGAGEYRAIEAELWLGGYAPECPAQSMPFRVNIVPPAAKFDEFGAVSLEMESEKLGLAVRAAQYVTDKVYVIGYAGRKSERMYANTALRRMRDQLLKSGFPAPRINAFDGGFREEAAFEIWIVPEGAEPPKASPTIDRKDIVFPPVTRTTRPNTRRP